jgi:hypothetical protein
MRGRVGKLAGFGEKVRRTSAELERKVSKKRCIMLSFAALQEEDFRPVVGTGYRDPDTLALFFSLDLELDDMDLSAGPACALPGGRRRRRRTKLRVSDAMIESNPIDPLALARCVAVAKVDAPIGRIRLAHVFQRPLHRLVLLVDARLLPLAGEPDVEGHRFIQWSGRGRSGGTTENNRRKGKHTPHR